MDVERFLWVNAFGIGMGLCSQGLGYVIGTVFDILVSVKPV